MSLRRELPSMVSNRMYAFGESYANAKAFVLANFSTDPTNDATYMDSIQASITTLGGEAPEARSASWYLADQLYSLASGATGQNQATTALGGVSLTGQAGKVLETLDGATFSFGSGGGGGVTTLAAVGAVPNANAGVIAGSTLTLEPADATHPGVVTAVAQTFGGAKVIGGSYLGPQSTYNTLNFGGNTTTSNSYISDQAGYLLISGQSGFELAQNNSEIVFATAGFFQLGRTNNNKIGFMSSDLSGTPGAGTANTASGIGAVVSASSATFKITKSTCAATSLIMVWWMGVDATAGAISAIYTSGGFNVSTVGTAAGNTKFGWLVFN